MKEETINRIDKIKEKAYDHQCLTGIVAGLFVGAVVCIPYVIGFNRGKADMLRTVKKNTEPIIQKAFDIGGECMYKTIKEKAPIAFESIKKEVSESLTVDYPAAIVDPVKGTIKAVK